MKNFLKRRADQQILNFPVMKKETKARVVEMHDCAYQAYMCGKGRLVASTLKQFRMTFQHGVCPHSAVALGYYGVIWMPWMI